MPKNKTMSKPIFQDLAPADRKKALEENAYSSELRDIRRMFTDAELEEKKEQLSEETIEKLDAEEELKKLSRPLKEMIKEKNEVIRKVSRDLRLKYYERNEQVFYMADYAEDTMHEYDGNGIWLSSRPLRANEKQLRITGTNE